MYLSATRIRDALACPKKYRLAYIEKIWPEKKAISLIFGSVLHTAIENFHLSRDGDVVPEMDYLVKEAWIKEVGNNDMTGLMLAYGGLLGDMKQAEAELEKLAAEIKEKRPDIKNPAATKEYKQEKEKVLAPFNDTLESFKRQAAEIVLDSEYRFTTKGPLELFTESLEIGNSYVDYWNGIEQKPEILHNEVSFKLELEGFVLSGKVDRVDINPQTGDIEIVDYKTNAQAQSYLESFVQNAAYYLGVAKTVGIEPTAMKYHYLRLNREVIYPVDKSHVSMLLELMHAAREVHQLSYHYPSFQTCAWCNYFEECKKDFGYKEAELNEPATCGA